MKRREALKVIGAAGVAAGLPSLSRAYPGNWRLLNLALPYLSHITGFGGTANTTHATFTPGTTVYIDPSAATNGSGTSYTSPLNTFPSSLANNTKYLVKAGTTVACDWTQISVRCQMTNVSNVIVSVYAPSTGSEITNQPNPFSRAVNDTLGHWVSSYELSTMYFRMAGSAPEFVPTSTRAGIFFQADGSGSNIVIRGVYMEGAAHSALQIHTGSIAVRLEDCVIAKTGFLPGGSSYFGTGFSGNAIRWLNSAGGGQPQQLVRCFIDGTGDDTIHAASYSAGFYISDCAIRAHALYEGYVSQHSDALQIPFYPGAFTINRTVIEHYGADTAISNDNGTNTLPIGNGLNDTEAGISSFGLTGGQVTDCIMMSNMNCFNYTAAKPIHTRVLSYLHRRPMIATGEPVIRAMAGAALANLTEINCASVFDNMRTGDALYSAAPIGNSSTYTFTASAP